MGMKCRYCGAWSKWIYCCIDHALEDGATIEDERD